MPRLPEVTSASIGFGSVNYNFISVTGREQPSGIFIYERKFFLGFETMSCTSSLSCLLTAVRPLHFR